jgi:hypothetical protein
MATSQYIWESSRSKRRCRCKRRYRSKRRYRRKRSFKCKERSRATKKSYSMIFLHIIFLLCAARCKLNDLANSTWDAIVH